MSQRDHFTKLIDNLEYYLTKDLEATIYGTGDTCYLTLYDRMTECIKARKEIDYKPCQSVEELLESHGYDKQFINKFLTRIHYCKNNIFDDGEMISIRERMMIIIDILEYYITKKIERTMLGDIEQYSTAYYERLVECINARKEINYVPYQSVEKLLEEHSYDEEFIKKFITNANL